MATYKVYLGNDRIFEEIEVEKVGSYSFMDNLVMLEDETGEVIAVFNMDNIKGFLKVVG